MDTSEKVRSPVALPPRVGTGETTASVARAALLSWGSVDAKLGPLIGRGGVAALYRYCPMKSALSDSRLASAQDLT